MNPISNNFASGFNPSQIQQKMQERFKATDVDESGTLTKTELTEALSAKGMDASKVESKVDQMFDKMDADQDGEISLEEQQEMFESMQSRMSSFHSAGEIPAAGEDSNSIKSLLESIAATDDVDDDIKQKITDALEKMQAEGNSRNSLSESVSLLNNILPAVDETV